MLKQKLDAVLYRPKEKIIIIKK